MLRIAIAEDHALVRKSLALLINTRVELLPLERDRFNK